LSKIVAKSQLLDRKIMRSMIKSFDIYIFTFAFGIIKARGSL